MFKLGKSTIRNMRGVDERLIVLASQAILETKQDFTIVSSGGLRTAEEQNEIFKRGASQLDGYKHKSYHQSGKALDLVPFIDGKAIWDKDACKEIVRAVKKVAKDNGINIICGADWDWWDGYHFQLED